MSNKEFKQKYKGRWKLYLNDKTPEALAKRNEFYGEWLTKKSEIFSKRRKYKAVIYPVTQEGVRLEEVPVILHNTVTYSELSQIIFKFANEWFEEWLENVPDINIDTNQSYCVVRA